MADRRRIERQPAGPGRPTADEPATASSVGTGEATARGRYLTAGWNNALAVGLGLLLVAFAAVSLTSTTFSNRASFIGIVAIGTVY